MDIRAELLAPKPNVEPCPDWTVETDPIEGVNHLLYKGVSQQQNRTPAGLATIKELAALFNRNQTVPKKQKSRCAADSKNPGAFTAKRAKQSPELPLESTPARPYVKQDFELLLTYMESLFDESPLGSVKRPVFFEDVETHIDVSSEITLTFLAWLYLVKPKQLPSIVDYLAWDSGEHDRELPRPGALEKLENSLQVELDADDFTALLKLIRFIHQLPTPEPKTTMSAAPATAAPAVESFPASHFRRYPSNRTPDEEAIAKIKASVLDVGILVPLLGRLIAGDPLIELIGGETRWCAAKAIDPEFSVPVILLNITDKEAAKIHAIDNFQRTDLNDIQQAEEIQNMLSHGWEMEDVQEFLGKGRDYIYYRLRLLKLPAEGRQAVLDGNLSILTANKIISLPEESRDEAIKSVTAPTHAARALPEREALALIQKNFIEPLEKAKEWEERRDLLEKENPGAEWLEYQDAREAAGKYERTDTRPSYAELSDAARTGELVVPTWGELAKKHGATIYIGLNYMSEAKLYVDEEPLILAEKVAHDDNPEECIFAHEKAVEKSRNAAAKRKQEDEEYREALAAERPKLQALILSPDGIKPAALEKFIESSYLEILEYGVELDEIGDLFEVPADCAAGDVQKAALKYIRSKSFGVLEGLGRIHAAAALDFGGATSFLTSALFTSGAIKKEAFPASFILHTTYQARLEKLAAEVAAAATPEEAADARASELDATNTKTEEDAA
ncbi:MAG: ParB/RepB/Spo0J family partition protein [Luteolibacter sp.]